MNETFPDPRSATRGPARFELLVSLLCEVGAESVRRGPPGVTLASEHVGSYLGIPAARVLEAVLAGCTSLDAIGRHAMGGQQ